MIKVSIIIPVIEINDYLRESIPKILKLDNQDFEIIVLPNKKTNDNWAKTRVVPTGFSNPSKKRNLGVKKARGKIIAFLDDDAYPKANWIDRALIHFKDKKIIGVGGPAITPKNDSILQKASGAMSESLIGGGKARKRFISSGKKDFVDDWPSVNLLVKRDVFIKSGGFDPRYWPGEDTKLCLEITRHGKIIYDPKVIVCHHRRASLIKHLKQNGNYGLHRGHFARRYPQNSLKLFYLMPSLFVIYLLLVLTLVILNSLQILSLKITIHYLLLPLYLYFLLIILDIIIISIRHKNPLVGMATIPYIFLTHLYYGIRFIKGYFSNDISKNTHHKKNQ
jgi:GT2 family glycosyltransferase